MQYSIYDLRRFDIKPPSPLVDEHRYFGNPPTPHVGLRSLWTAPWDFKTFENMQKKYNLRKKSE